MLESEQETALVGRMADRGSSYPHRVQLPPHERVFLPASERNRKRPPMEGDMNGMATACHAN